MWTSYDNKKYDLIFRPIFHEIPVLRHPKTVLNSLIGDVSVFKVPTTLLGSEFTLNQSRISPKASLWFCTPSDLNF